MILGAFRVAAAAGLGLLTAQTCRAAEPSPPGAIVVVPAGTQVELIVDDSLSSKSSKEGDRFRLHLAEVLIVDGVRLVPEGAIGEGEVVHAARPGLGGKGGELIIAARYIDHGGVRLPLGHFRWGRSGADKTNLALAATSAFGPAGLFITGGNITAPAGTWASARTTADVALPAPPAAHSPPPDQGIQP